MIYLGSLGRMIGIKSPAQQGVASDTRHRFDRSLEGRVKAQVLPVGRRTWTLQTSAATTPTEYSTLEQFASGAWGTGPFQFVSADAAITNLLTPDESLCMGDPIASYYSAGGPVDLGVGGWSARSWVHSDSSLAGEIYFQQTPAPILPGVRVTGSAWIRGEGAKLRLYWYDSPFGNPIAGTVDSGPLTIFDGWTRVTVIGDPPEGAIGVRVVAQYADFATMPAITWTKQAKPWGSGQGCSKAVVSQLERSQVRANEVSNLSRVSFAVTEVG